MSCHFERGSQREAGRKRFWSKLSPIPWEVSIPEHGGNSCKAWMASSKPALAYVACQRVFKEMKGRKVRMHKCIERF